MRLTSCFVTVLALVTLSSSTGAQERAQVARIDSGMTKAQVVERFGKPAGERSRGEYTYLFFSNGLEKQVGMSDVVILQGDQVVDAVLRSPRRAYSGTSSSPKAISAQEAARKGPTLKGPGTSR